MEKVAFSIGILDFHWYGIIVSLAVLTGLVVSLWQARLYRERLEPVIDLVICGVPVVLIISRINYILVNYDLFSGDPWECFYIWHGGLAIYGALFGMLLVLYFYTRINKMSFWKWADILAPGIILGQAVGQWANFINQEAFGYPTNLPWAIYIDYVYRPLGFEQYDFFHPVFLYSSGWDIAIFLLLLGVLLLQRYYKKLPAGTIFLLYLLLYSTGKFFTEEIRIDSEMMFGVRITQIFSVILFGLAVWLLIYINKRKQEG